MKCQFEGCDKPVKSRGLCSGHWQQQAEGLVLRPLLTLKRLHKDDKGRVCTACETYKTWDEFYRLSKANSDGHRGYRSQCKDCWRAKENQNRALRLARAQG